MSQLSLQEINELVTKRPIMRDSLTNNDVYATGYADATYLCSDEERCILKYATLARGKVVQICTWYNPGIDFGTTVIFDLSFTTLERLTSELEHRAAVMGADAKKLAQFILDNQPTIKQMNVFFDTEFLEGFDKPVFGKRRHYIDLVSIGLVDDQNREYYALSKDFRPSNANEWVRENVFPKLVDEYVQTFSGDGRGQVLSILDGKTIVGQINYIQDKIGKTDKKISEEIVQFVFGPAVAEGDGMSGVDADIEWWLKNNKVQFWADYCAYDWVLLCSLFGTMMDLPKGFPMYCNDTQQLMLRQGLSEEWRQRVSPDPVGAHNALVDAKWCKGLFHAIEAAQRDGTGH